MILAEHENQFGEFKFLTEGERARLQSLGVPGVPPDSGRVSEEDMAQMA